MPYIIRFKNGEETPVFGKGRKLLYRVTETQRTQIDSIVQIKIVNEQVVCKTIFPKG